MVRFSLSTLCLGLSALTVQSVQASTFRYVFYYDQYHLTVPNKTITTGIDYVITAFANSSLFTTEPAGKYVPFENVTTVRSRFDSGTKVMIAIGGWGDTAGFGLGSASEESRKLYAANIAAMVKEHNFDGADIDWEYPGGNGADYRKIPNSEKVAEIDNFPLLLAEIRKALGPDKLLTIATPGKRVDMIAFTPEKAPAIWESVDWVNIMTYDLINRRDNITKHHTDVEASLETVEYYIKKLKLEPSKINLGFPMYSKWFTVKSNKTCETGLGCETVSLEAADGSDTGKSGTVTFEASNFLPPPEDMSESTNGTCGPISGLFCSTGFCCSTGGFCGNTDEYCNTCQGPEYGSGCNKTGISTLFQKAMKNGITDKEAGGEYYYDRENSLFWTWDTAELIERKFDEIVKSQKLGGVMAWSIGQDGHDSSRILAIQKGVAEKRNSPPTTSGANSSFMMSLNTAELLIAIAAITLYFNHW